MARYGPTGAVQNTYQIAGDVDGLKYNPFTGLVWAIQNQDANSHLTLIDPATNTLTGVSFAATSPTQGVDDVAFIANGTNLSYTNPTAPTDVTLQKVVDGSNPIAVTSVATVGTPGTNLVTGQSGYVLPAANTDSLKVAPNGDLVQTTGNRNVLAFIHDAGTASQSVGYLPLTADGAAVSGTDDSLYLTSALGRIYAAVSNTNQVLAINHSGAVPGSLIASVGSLGEIALVDPSTGDLTPFVTDLPGIHGLALATPVPEPASLAVVLVGLFLSRRLRSTTLI